MQEFYALSSSPETDVMKEQYMGNVRDAQEIPVTPQGQQGQMIPLQIILFGDPSGQYAGAPVVGLPVTEQLASISNASTAPSLIAALQSTMSPKTTKRTVVIPGTRKQAVAEKAEQNESSFYHKWLTPRIRHGIVICTILFVAITTLLTLTPLSNGQFAFSLVGGISNWFRAGELTWQIQSHIEDSVSSSASTAAQNTPLQPPMNLPRSQYITIAQQDAVDAGISPEYFVRQINQESGFNPYAVSPAGAIGIAQFEPGTAAGLGVNPWDPISALRGAARLMASYANSYGGNYAMALAAYNGGTGTVQYAVRACGGNWMNCLPGQTRNYIYVIMGI
jgi:hypothetical protein